MKNIVFICTLLFCSTLFAQQKIRGAESFVLTIPKDYQRTIGLNDYATIQFESIAPKPNSYGFLIFEHKDELKLADPKLDMIDYTLNSIEPYTTQNGFKYLKKPYVSYEQGFNFAYAEFETNEPESGHIYFLQTVIETKEFVYQILQYCSFEDRDIMKSDFVSIVNSFKLK
ncbi:hypothetical protein NZD85_14040 [Empedobacter stercoris]|uniref:hypothetical protein n=1 Tax=Empedobacter stercoris TaxID=1628248 RepID=UPI0016625307|nr:hypothetical protein [Empedobacter stercoris]HJD87244.1 hypothetical protein [Empedobacter falsenii]MCA4777411.1 hypothetical protein [Empedobacter stercoris]MCA4810288.1 hypothetical protein [Empedobacter stercoris]QNT14534.1 hypothetical protein HNV03_07575 [Empedobacter stercoris]UWX66955.1 hypothetical protein NZD85_14040 [Empedobacter stercoris]